jgi:Ca-activated chloride channel family protein
MGNGKNFKRCSVTGFAVLLLLFLLPGWTGQANEGQPEGKTLSPYFYVKSGEDDQAQLPLKETSAEVNIAGIIADVKIRQVYQNTGKSPVEAIYIFPGSTRSAVHGMRMTVGDRVRVAKIKEKETAKAEYAKAKKEGKSASLLEQHRPNVFQMSVANIMPGDQIKVELFYTESLVPTDGVYEFVYPTVVGPRYSNRKKETAPPGEHWVENPYLHEGILPTYAFDMKLNVAAGVPIREIASPSHLINVAYDGQTRAAVTLDGKEAASGNKDFILKYRLQGGKIESGLLLFQDKGENFFLLTMEPPKRPSPSQIPPREYLYIVDVSGSMHGFPLEISKTLIKELVSRLRPMDRFNVLLFAAGSQVLSENALPANPVNIRRAIDLIDRQRGGGGTQLIPALQRALDLPHEENISRTIVIATDGYVDVEKKAFEIIRGNLDKANVFAFGIGTSVNRFLIEGIARAGSGEPFVVTRREEALSAAAKFLEYIEMPVLTGIRVEYDGFDVCDVDPPSIPDVFAQRPVVLSGKWKGSPEGTITIRGLQGDKRYAQEIEVGSFRPLPANSALKYLWARNRIRALSDDYKIDADKDRKEEITRLGLTYNLLTEYTSFIAVDNLVRNVSGESTTVKQPLPLPEGVSDLAVGGTVPTVPEPETYALLFVVGSLMLWSIRARLPGFGFLLRSRRNRG